MVGNPIVFGWWEKNRFVDETKSIAPEKYNVR
jgi:hypothetical protein